VRRSQSSAELAGAALIVLAAVCFGTLGPLSRYAGDAGVTSLALVAWRAALGAGCMGLFVALLAAGGRHQRGLGDASTRDWWLLGAIAVANALLNLAVFEAFARISIALTLLIFYLYPALVALASVAWFGERLDRARWVALALSLTGTVMVMAGAGSLGGIDPVGVGLAFVGAVVQTAYVLIARHGFRGVPAPQAAGLSMAGAALIYVAIAAATGQLSGLAQPLAGIDALWPVALAGVIGAGVPTLSFMSGVRRLGAPRAAILATLEPVVGVGLAALLLAERPTPVQLVGGLLIIGAGVLLQRRQSGAALAEHEGLPAGDTA
jgi:drug/metabolite transporter (DMT)-like permease